MRSTFLSLFLLLSALAPAVAAPPVSFDIDGAKKTPISPFIYGTNQPNWQGNSKYLTLTRWGGNRITAYNWETNASNAGSDWQHQNDSYLSQSDTPGEPVRKLVAAAQAAGAATVVTVPIAGYVAADKKGDGDVNKTPDYLKTRFVPSLPRKGAPFSLQPDVRDGKVYQDEFVNWLEKAFPATRKDPARTIFYALDNEPDLWSHTHARIHPQKARYDEVARLNAEYSAAIKAVAPAALVFGPVNYGWQGFVALQDAPDRQGRDFLDFYLSEMRAAEKHAKRRLLDVLDVHWYPEARGGNVRVVEDDARPEVASSRIQSPRSLWDPNYTESSWIAKDVLRGPICLLPRLREKIQIHYPGTRLAITEYYYGGGSDISGAIAQADVLGIFGREGLFAAAIWHMGGTDDRFIYAGFAMFRNYDGHGASFGETGLAARTSDPQKTSIYASMNASRQVVLVAINKAAEATPVQIGMKNCPKADHATVYQLTQSTAAPVLVGEVSISPTGRLTYEMPAMSVSTIVLDGR